MHVTELEYSVGDGERMCGAEAKEPKTICITFASSMAAQHLFPYVVICSNPGNEVAKEDQLVLPRDGLQGGVE